MKNTFKRIYFIAPLLFCILIISYSCKKNEIPTCTIYTPENGTQVEHGEMVTIKVESDDPDGSISEIRFYINGEGVASSADFPYQYSINTELFELGIYTIKAEAIDLEGAKVTDEIEIEVIERTYPPVAFFTADILSGQAPLTVSFTDTSLFNPTTWRWSFGDGDTSNLQHPVHTYKNQGRFTVSLKVTNHKGWDNIYKYDYINVTPDLGIHSPCPGEPIMTDIDGNEYNTVYIMGQCWMQSSLRTSRFADGTSIPKVQNNYDWGALGDNATDMAFCYVDNDPESELGAYYTWAAAIKGNISCNNVQGVCPDGWHLPSSDEWNLLISNLNSVGRAGGMLKETGNEHWLPPNAGATNESLFTSIAEGSRNHEMGTFDNKMKYGNYWSSTQSNSSSVIGYHISYTHDGVESNNYKKSYGFSVRCIKNQDPM